MKTLFRVLVILFIAVAIVIGGAFVAVRIFLPASKVKALVLPQVEKVLGRTADFKSFGLSIYPILGVKLEGLTIANTSRNGFSEKPMVAIGTFRIGVKVLPLLKKKVEISRVIIASSKIFVECDSSGFWNYEDLAFMAAADTPQKPRSGGLRGMFLPVPITLERLTVSNLCVEYNDRKGGMRIVLGEINQNLVLDIDQRLENIHSRGSLVVSQIVLAGTAVAQPLDGLTMTFKHAIGLNLVAGRLVIDTAQVSLQTVAFTVSGTVDSLTTNPVYDLNIALPQTSLGMLLKEIPVSVVPELARLDASGELAIDATVRGTADSVTGIPTVAGVLVLDNGLISYTDLPEAINGLGGTVLFTTNSADIQHLCFNLGSDPVELNLKLDNFARPAVDGTLKAAVDLRNLKNILDIPQGMSCSGRLHADLRARGLVDPADPTILDFSGTVALGAVTVEIPAVAKPVVMDGTVSFSSSSISANLKSRIGSSSLAFNATLKQYLQFVLPDLSKQYPRANLTFSIDAPVLNTDEIIAPAGTNAVSGQTKPHSGGDAALLLAAPLPGVDVMGTVSSREVIYKGIKLSKVNGKFQNRSDRISMDVTAGISDGTMRHQLDIDARNYADLKVKSVLTVGGVDAGQFVSDMTVFLPQDQELFVRMKDLKDNLTGTASIKTNATTHGGTTQQLTANLVGNVDSRLENGEIGGRGVEGLAAAARALKIVNLTSNRIPFRTFKILLDIHDEKVFFTDVRAESPAIGGLGMRGYVGFDSYVRADIRWRHTLAHSRMLVRVENGLKDILGSRIRGTAGALLGSIEMVPTDKDGRATSLWVYDCPMAHMKQPVLKGFAAGDGTRRKTPSAKQQVVNTTKAAVRAEAAKAVETAKEKAVEAAKPAQEAVKKKVNDEIKKAARKLKRLF